jgi:CheY-like chemotaxis protein
LSKKVQHERAGRILVLDDEERWRNILNSLLCGAGFVVDVAGTTARARELLSENFYHVGVFDVSMVHGDAANIDGMRLLSHLDADNLRRGMQVVLISAYADKPRLREAFKKYKVADFQDKYEFEEAEFVELVREVLAESVNLDVDVQWESRGQREQAVLSLSLEGERVKRDSPLQARMAEELDDLLCRLFRNTRSLLVRPLAPGSSGSGVLHVTPFYDDGAAQPVVVKFGASGKVRQEHANFKKYIQPFISGRSTASSTYADDPLAASSTPYSQRRRQNRKFCQLLRSAQQGQINQNPKTVDLRDVRAWYANSSHLQLRNLTDEYKQLLEFTDEKLARALSPVERRAGQRATLL